MRKNGVDKTLTSIEGGVCAPEGFLASGVCCGVSKAHFAFEDKNQPDFALITGVKHKRYPVAGVFASGAFESVNTELTKRHIRYEYAQGVLITSGIANTFGEVARENALRLCKAVERASGLAKDELVVCSTGLLGKPFPVADFEGKAEVILQKLKAHGIDWPMEVCRYVALNVSSGVKQIEGEINRNIACKELY